MKFKKWYNVVKCASLLVVLGICLKYSPNYKIVLRGTTDSSYFLHLPPTSLLNLMQPSFSDHFSSLADTYARYRPHYPDELFAYLADIAPHRISAWDCATGNGQAAIGLAKYFENVEATDASKEQIASATVRENIRYRVASAELSGLESASIDLCTVAQAIHWFHFDSFYSEVRRVLKPGSILAIWTYSHSRIAPAIDAVMQKFYGEIRPYFPPERQWVDDEYTTLPFPFEEIMSPHFVMTAAWGIEDILGYYRSWSAVKQYAERHGRHPLDDVESALRDVWNTPEITREVRWNLHLRLGRV